MTETIEIKYFTDKIEKLTYIDGKSDWIDLRAAQDVDLKQGEFKLIPLGTTPGQRTTAGTRMPPSQQSRLMPSIIP